VVDRFSPHCRRALAATEREARSLKHGHVATEHLLLGLLRTEESVAAQALRLMGVTYAKARRHVVRLVDVGSERPTGAVSFTPRVREILEDALTGSLWLVRLGESLVGPGFEPSPTTPSGRPVPLAAPRLGHRRAEVRTEDVLLALIAHGEGVGARVLSDLDVDLDRAAVACLNVRFPRPEGWSFQLPFAPPATWPPFPPKRN
jgi:ATP-dependent Clp protease ATP-binding subunit ClpC